MATLKHLTEDHIKAALEDLQDYQSLDIERLPIEAANELIALLWYGSPRAQPFDFEWHLDHYQQSLPLIDFISAANLRRGIAKLRAER